MRSLIEEVTYLRKRVAALETQDRPGSAGGTTQPYTDYLVAGGQYIYVGSEPILVTFA